MYPKVFKNFSYIFLSIFLKTSSRIKKNCHGFFRELWVHDSSRNTSKNSSMVYSWNFLRILIVQITLYVHCRRSSSFVLKNFMMFNFLEYIHKKDSLKRSLQFTPGTLSKFMIPLKISLEDFYKFQKEFIKDVLHELLMLSVQGFLFKCPFKLSISQNFLKEFIKKAIQRIVFLIS